MNEIRTGEAATSAPRGATPGAAADAPRAAAEVVAAVLTPAEPTAPPYLGEEPGPVTKFAERLDTSTTYLRNLALNLLAIAALVVAVPLVVAEMLRSPVSIDRIAVPEAIEKQGLTGDVVANRLWDAWSAVTAETAITKDGLSVMPTSLKVEFEVPDSGISFTALIHHVRRFFGLVDTRITGELVCTADPCTRETVQMRLRVLRDTAEVIDLPAIGSTPEDVYYKRAIAEVLRHLDPVRAITFLRADSSERALAELRRLVRARHPDAKWALNGIGLLLTNRGDVAGARAAFEDALRLDPGYTIARVNLAAAIAAEGDRTRALAEIDAVLAATPNDAKAWMNRGEIQVRAKDLPAAIADYRKAAAALPNSPWPVFRLGLLHGEAGDARSARAAFLEAIEIDPDFHDARYGLARLALLAGDQGEVVVQFAEIVRLKPRDAEALFALARAQAAAKAFEPAIESYRKGLDLAPDKPAELERLADLLVVKGALEEARGLLDKAIRLDAGLALAWYRLGDVRRRLGDKDGARQAFETYLRLDGQSVYAVLAKRFLETDLAR